MPAAAIAAAAIAIATARPERRRATGRAFPDPGAADGAPEGTRAAQAGQSGANPGRASSASKTAKHRLHVTWAIR